MAGLSNECDTLLKQYTNLEGNAIAYSLHIKYLRSVVNCAKIRLVVGSNNSLSLQHVAKCVIQTNACNDACITAQVVFDTTRDNQTRSEYADVATDVFIFD
jgi:hypothetical protein